jgi:hypothetical protein
VEMRVFEKIINIISSTNPTVRAPASLGPRAMQARACARLLLTRSPRQAPPNTLNCCVGGVKLLLLIRKVAEVQPLFFVIDLL